MAVIVDEKEPVSAPRDVAADWSKARYVDHYTGAVAIASDVGNFDRAVFEEFGFDDADWSFEPVCAGPDAIEMRECRDDADSSVAAHAEIRDVVEKQHAGDARFIDRSAQKRADKCVRTAGFIDYGGTKIVVFGPEAYEAFGEWSVTQVRLATNHDARRLAGGMRIDHSDAVWSQDPHILS